MVNRASANASAPYVRTNDIGGMMDMVEHLVQMGTQRSPTFRAALCGYGNQEAGRLPQGTEKAGNRNTIPDMCLKQNMTRSRATVRARSC